MVRVAASVVVFGDDVVGQPGLVRGKGPAKGFLFLRRGIGIEQVTGSPFQIAILGHELGHVVFHRKVDIKASGYDEQEISDTEYDIVTGKKNLSTERDWIEWQANRFASAVLMPRVPVYLPVITFQKEKGIVHNVGKVWLDNQPENKSNFSFILEYLKKLFEVNVTNVEYRLADLGILEDRRLMDVKHISELFKTE